MVTEDVFPKVLYFQYQFTAFLPVQCALYRPAESMSVDLLSVNGRRPVSQSSARA
jgi:hypothetical protein